MPIRYVQTKPGTWEALCKECGEKIDVDRASAWGRTRQYCSDACKQRAYRRRKKHRCIS